MGVTLGWGRFHLVFSQDPVHQKLPELVRFLGIFFYDVLSFQRVLSQVVELKARGVVQIIVVDQLPSPGSHCPDPIGNVFGLGLLVTGTRGLDKGDAVLGFLPTDDRHEGTAFKIVRCGNPQ